MKMMCSVGPFYGSALSLKEFAEKSVKHGYDGIEIGLDGIVWPYEIKNEDIEAVKKMNIPIGVHLPFNYVIAETEEEYGVFREGTEEYFLVSMEKAVKFAKKIKAEYCVYHPTMQILTDKKPGNAMFLDALSVAKTLAAEVNSLCTKEKIKLCIENIIPYFDSPIEVMNEFSVISKDIRICFDIGINILDFTQLGKKEIWTEWLKKYREKIHVVHFSDTAKAKKISTHHMKLGTGNMDFEKFFKSMKESGAEYLVSEEAFSEFSAEKQKLITWAERSATLAKIRKWLE